MTKRPFFWITAAAAGLVLVLVFILLLVSFTNPGGLAFLFPDSSRPSAVILAPEQGSIIHSGDTVTVAVYVSSPSKLGPVEFLVDDVVAQRYEAAPGTNEMLVYFPWLTSKAGMHHLSAVPYSIQGVPGIESSIVLGVRAAELSSDTISFPDEEEARAAISEEHDQSGEQEVEDEQGDPGNPDEADEAHQGANDGEVEPEEQAGGQAEAPEEEADPALNAEQGDDPPEIIFLESSMEVMDDEDGGHLQVTVIVAAADDLGLDRLKMTWVQPGAAQPVVGETTRICAGRQQCMLEVTDQDPLQGLWVYQVTAWDTTGQASSAFERFEVLEGPAEPPAAAEHDDDEEWLSDWLRDQLDSMGSLLEMQEAFPWSEPLAAEDLLEQLAGNSHRENPEQPDAVGSRCVQMSAEVVEQGIQIRAEVTCDFEVDEDQILFPHLFKYVSHTGDRGSNLFINEWFDLDMHVLPTGTVFTWLDPTVTCGTSYRYGMRIDTAEIRDPSQRSFNAVRPLINVGRAEIEVNNLSCDAGSIADINLRAELLPERVRVRWEVPGGRDWPDDLPDEGVLFTLEHFDELTRNSWVMFRETVPLDRLLDGHNFQLIHPQTCGEQSWYTVSAAPAGSDMEEDSTTWLIRQQIRGPEIPCMETGIESIDLAADPHWSAPNRHGILLGATIPSDFPWPEDDSVELYLVRQRIAQAGCEGPPCLEGGWQVRKSMEVTDDMQGREFVLSMYDQDVFFDEEYVYALGLRVGVVNPQLTFGPGVSVTTDPSSPPPPQITRLVVSSASCPAGVDRCATVEWDPYVQPVEGGYYEQAESIVLVRIVGGLDEQVFPLELFDTSYADNDLFEMEIEMANGSMRHICNYTVTYRLLAYDASGHWFGASPLTVDMLACDIPMEQVVEGRR